MGAMMSDLVRAALGDARANGDERRAVTFELGCLHGRVQRLQIGTVLHRLHVPPISAEAIRLDRRAGQVGAALDRDPVVVEHPDEPAQALVPGHGRGLVRYPLHEVAVRADGPGMMADHVVPGAVVVRRQPPLRDGHAHRVGHALAQRARGCLDARRVPDFGVARSAGAPLAEAHQLLQREIVPREVEKRVEQHRSVSWRKNKAISVWPARVRGIVPEMFRKQEIAQRRETHRCAWVPRVGLLYRVHGQDPDHVHAQLFQIRAHRLG